ncbi:hypothetical protein CsatA_025806 [Cannabis sativa]
MAVTRSRSSSLSPSPKKPKKKSIKESKPKSIAQTSSKPPKQKFKVVVTVGEPSSGDARKGKRKRIDNDNDFVSVRPRKFIIYLYDSLRTLKYAAASFLALEPYSVMLPLFFSLLGVYDELPYTLPVSVNPVAFFPIVNAEVLPE